MARLRLLKYSVIVELGNYYRLYVITEYFGQITNIVEFIKIRFRISHVYNYNIRIAAAELQKKIQYIKTIAI